METERGLELFATAKPDGREVGMPRWDSHWGILPRHLSATRCPVCGQPYGTFSLCAFGKTRWNIAGRTCACQGQPVFDSGHSTHDGPYVLQTSALSFLMGINQFPGLSVPLQLDCRCHGQFCSFRNYVRLREPHRFNRHHDAFLFQDFSKAELYMNHVAVDEG